MAIRNEVIDKLLAGQDPRAVFFQDGLLGELKKALAERILNAELDQRLASERAEADGTKEILGQWIGQTEGAEFWLRVMPPRKAGFAGPRLNQLRHRGVTDMLIVIVDGLKGFPDAISAVFPEPSAQVQTCIVHLIRHFLTFAPWKERRAVAAGLKPIYRAADAEIAHEQLEEFAAGPWGKRYPAVAPAQRRQWERIVPFFSYPLEIRRIIYTTNAIESLHSRLRKAVRARGHFLSDAAASKLLFLVLREVSRNWKMRASRMECRPDTVRGRVRQPLPRRVRFSN